MHEYQFDIAMSDYRCAIFRNRMSFFIRFSPARKISFGLHTKSINKMFDFTKKCFADANIYLGLVLLFLKNLLKNSRFHLGNFWYDFRSIKIAKLIIFSKRSTYFFENVDGLHNAGSLCIYLVKYTFPEQQYAILKKSKKHRNKRFDIAE
jgi:hypothetical protein